MIDASPLLPSLIADNVSPAQTVEAPPTFSDDDHPTVEAVVEQKRRKEIAKAPESEPEPEPPAKTKEPSDTDAEPAAAAAAQTAPPTLDGMEELEEDAGQQAAFDPVTGEINWDCPCLGGMAHGPCGEDFKAAFSCFVHSTEEPKGMDCIEKFQYVYLYTGFESTC